MKKLLSKEEFVKAVLEMKDCLTMQLECEEGSIEQMQFERVPFNGGVTLYTCPMSNEVGILQDNGFGSYEDNIAELFDTLEQYFYYPIKEKHD